MVFMAHVYACPGIALIDSMRLTAGTASDEDVSIFGRK
jgi:hypothetical protein